MNRKSIAAIAAAITIAGTGSATATALITGGQIKDETITSRDIRDGSVRLSDLAKEARPAPQQQQPACPSPVGED